MDESIRWNLARFMGRLQLEDRAVRSELLRLYSAERLGVSVRAGIGIALLQLGETQVTGDLKRFLADADVNLYMKKKSC